jgi:hypothetical protein
VEPLIFKTYNEMNENLKYVFANINEWLKFAEVKNAGLLALNAAAIFGILQSQSIFEKEFKLLSGSMLSLFLLSALLCIYSIVPDLRTARFKSKFDNSTFQTQINNLNFLFFGTISKLTKDQYINLIKYNDNNFLNTRIDESLIEQIIVNAEIANFKVIVFDKASWLTFVAFFLGILTIIFKVLI